MLDSGPLGRLAHPRPNQRIVGWVKQLRRSGVAIVLPEIADYEVRRSLLLEELARSIERLDQLKRTLTYAPITTDIILKAAELWALARRRGKPTADPKELDGDAILAAQALEAGAIVATDNIGHLSLFVEAKDWKDLL
jgi:predicted nucleic acid-binding protein